MATQDFKGTLNGLTVTGTTGVFTLVNLKTFTVNNTLTLSGTDGSTLNIGTGGTLGTAAYTEATAYEAAGGIATHAALTTGVHGVGVSTVASVANIATHAALITGIHGLVFTAGQTLTVESSSILNQDLTTDASPTFANLTLTSGAGSAFLKGGGTTYFDIYGDTVDGADNKITRIGGGGDIGRTRGAYISLYGNEEATLPGDLVLEAGNVATGDIYFRTGNTDRMIIAYGGGVTVGGEISTGTLKVATFGVTVEAATALNQDLTSDASPTFNQGNFTTTHTTTALADHIGEHTGSHGLVLDNNTFINETANANVTLGLTINQGANDDQIIALKSSDVGHFITDTAEADTFGYLQKNNATDGGLFISGISEGTQRALVLSGNLGAADPVDTLPALTLRGAKSDGGTASTVLGNAESVLTVENYTTVLARTLGNGTFIAGSTNIPVSDVLGLNLMTNAKTQLINAVYGIVTPANVRLFGIIDQTGAVSTITDRATIGGATAHTITLRDGSLNAINASTCTPGVSGLAPYLTFDATHLWNTPDAADLSIASGAVKSIFVLMNPNNVTALNTILGKHSEKTGATQKEYLFWIYNNGLWITCYDDDAGGYIGRYDGDAVTSDVGSWHTYGVTKSTAETTSAFVLFRDGIALTSDPDSGGSYTAMEDKTALAGSYYLNSAEAVSGALQAKLSVTLFLAEELTAVQVARLDAVLRGFAGVVF